MISKFTINGFKGFEHLELPRLTRVTILGGRNNVGKTTVLEAMFMLFDRLNPQMIFRQFAWRGVNILSMEPDSMWAPVFNNYDLNKSICISVSRNNNEEKMTIKFNPNYIPVNIPADVAKSGAKGLQIRTDQKPTPSYALDITYDNEDMKNQTTHLLIGLEGMGMRIDNVRVKQRSAVFIGARVPANPSEDAERFGQLDIMGKQDKILEFLKLIEPNLKSLSSITVGGTSLIHGDIGLARKIPVSYMGDGVSRLLTIILAIATSKNGIVAIDECENGFHYSVMPKIWEGIARAAREFNCQVIGTTHSDECLKAAYKGFSCGLEKDLSYVRLDRLDNKTVAKTFNYEMLKVAIETNMEVR